MDDQMIRAAMRGERPARAAILRELQDVWFRFCLGLLGTEERAREAVQECAVRLLRNFSSYRGQSSFKTWAIGIAVNVVREMKRESKPERWPGQETTDEESADVIAEREETKSVIKASLASLPHRQREAVMLRFFEEMSVDETAAAMGCAAGTVKAAVFAALRAMRAKLTRLGMRSSR